MPAEPVYVPRMPPPPPALMTADELLHVRIPDKRVELVRGKLVVREPAGLRHGRIAMELARLLANYVHDRGMGRVYAAETGFAVARDPDTVRAPDVEIRRGAWRASTGRTGARPSSRPTRRSKAKPCCRGLRARSQRFSSSERRCRFLALLALI